MANKTGAKDMMKKGTMAHNNYKQNDPITFTGTKMETEVKGQQGQVPNQSKASGDRNKSKSGLVGSTTKLKKSEPVTKDYRGDKVPSKKPMKQSQPITKDKRGE
jgi:hypothetical protein